MGSSGSERVRSLETPTAEKRKAVRVWLLGGFRVSVGSRTITQDAWRLRKAAALIKLLALAPGHRMHREQAMDLLWPDSGRRAASNNLRKTLHVTRRNLDSAAGAGYLASEDESLVLCPGGELWVDVDAFEEAVATARRARDPGAYRAALELYSGELVPGDRYEEWAEGRRQELRHTWLSLHVELARAYEGRGEYEKGIELLQRTVLEEPTNEQLHVALMRLYALSERRGEALAQYGRLVEALSGQLNAQVSATTERLREEIAAGRFPPAQLTVPPTEEQSDFGRHNLLASRTSFVGREHEMMEIKRHLTMTRLLTLAGAGGSGKTRLALEIARGLVGAYPDGVWLVELAPISEGELVPQTVARALEIREQPGLPLTDTLVGALRTKKMLLILDNCEHLGDAVGGLVGLLLDICPHLRLLATSRQAIGAVGEVIWPVSLLSVPDPKRVSTVEQLEGYESVRLFVDRARQRNPAFALRPDNAQAVAQICVRLEGLPLAIELAAARIRMLPPKALLNRLSNRLKLLTGGPREFSERQRTLRSTIEWSFALLDEGEQQLFGRLAVFSGGCTLEAIEAICDTKGDPPVEAFEGVSSLLDKNLLGQEEGPGEEPRFVMLETIHEFAREKLGESPEAEEMKRVHAEYFLTLAEQAKPRINEAERDLWRSRLETEHGNLRAALRWAMDRQDYSTALRVADAIFWFWFHRGYWKEGRGWLEEALGLPTASTPTVERAEALTGVGILAWIQGDHDVARSRLEESVGLCRNIQYKYGLVHSLHFLSMEMLGQGDTKAARSMADESVEIARAGDSGFDLAIVLANLGLAAHTQDDYAVARSVLRECIEICRQIGDNWLLSLPYRHLGYMELRAANYEQATALFKEGLSALRDVKEKWFIARAVETLAISSAMQGDYVRAARLFGAGETLREAAGASVQEFYRPDYDRGIVAAREGTDRAAWEDARAQGSAMTLDEAVSYALEEQEETDPPTTSAPEEPSAGQAPVALTRREEEVAMLVAKQLSNRQIASELVLSEHTVATHVRNILKKSGLHSRTQITGWSIEQRH